MSSIDFGIQIEPQYGFTYGMIKEIAKTAEEIGFESIWVSDHLFMTQDSIDINCLECWTTLTAIALETKRLRLGPMVSSQSYRNPALMANIAASLDHISKGRVNYGIGAGWKEVEYLAYGYEFPSALTRIKQLREAIVIAKKLWTEEKASYEGDYYKIKEAICYPQPVQDPSIPIWVGGMGNNTLEVAAEHADAVNFAWSTPIVKFRERLQVLENHCSELGTDYDAIRKSAGLMITMASTKKKLKYKLEEQEKNRDTPYRRYLSRQPPNIIGIPDQVKNSIEKYIELGVDHFILRFNFGEEVDSLKLFSKKILKNYYN
ncbi:TIGR03560 family F420-dependent LLM class oxidoreductase [Candidatus Bathyarchaeota archaeon]|nr:TIGR03560 family F420-dependent LLM class oxidoreductase [Candidatus Bathyarchaeota archaeon]